MPAELQPYSSFSAYAVAPERVTDLKLSGGKTIPYVYSLAVASSVPYVRLIGSSVGQKLFSWNEKIVVPPGEMVTVANASFHRGDIVIQSGWDPGAKPQRVTVPLDWQSVAAVGILPAGSMPVFPADTRRCRRAYVTGFQATTNTPLTFYAIGIAKERSHPNSGPGSMTEADLGSQYRSIINFPINTDLGLVPLGDLASPNDSIHTLLDATTFLVSDPALQTQNGSLYYVIEYL